MLKYKAKNESLFKGHYTVCLLTNYILHYATLTSHRIQGNDITFQWQSVQAFGNCSNFIRLSIYTTPQKIKI
ncbi:hypothetical protein AA106_00870 [Photorhabdus laumondii subsp. laumondii]|nr:hypothetical protein A4R40_19360 [Photorhabdus laumondii subsp. laumondii]RAW75952.1 hypothetical protein CKY15_00900 [Photorhabdus sp. S7-51]RAW80448.1 hypothetical protein CKY06_01355 [Photorhabdus sp. S15-56]RAW89187.1 hypothetical protein CKY12_02745 [Photorhabdus sp. S12-55]AXG44176.1 hypothetical protein PluDJC_19270 [Photorhabdus laumondii subsp. laumondii]